MAANALKGDEEAYLEVDRTKTSRSLESRKSLIPFEVNASGAKAFQTRITSAPCR